MTRFVNQSDAKPMPQTFNMLNPKGPLTKEQTARHHGTEGRSFYSETDYMEAHEDPDNYFKFDSTDPYVKMPTTIYGFESMRLEAINKGSGKDSNLRRSLLACSVVSEINVWAIVRCKAEEADPLLLIPKRKRSTGHMRALWGSTEL